MIFNLMWPFILILIFYIESSKCDKLSQNMFTREVQLTSLNFTFAEHSAMKAYVNMRKFNRTHTAYNYNCTITKVIDNKFQFALEVQKWGDGGWKKNTIKYGSRDPCKSMKYTLGSDFENVMVMSNHSKNCPFTPGFYHFEDYCIKATHTPLVLQTGIHKVKIDIFEGKVWHFKIEIITSVTDVY